LGEDVYTLGVGLRQYLDRRITGLRRPFVAMSHL
jgi:hypothetical protein